MRINMLACDYMLVPVGHFGPNNRSGITHNNICAFAAAAIAAAAAAVVGRCACRGVHITKTQMKNIRHIIAPCILHARTQRTSHRVRRLT